MSERYTNLLERINQSFDDLSKFEGSEDSDKLLEQRIEKQKIVWEYSVKDNGDAFFSSPAVGKDFVIIGSRDGYIHCVRKHNGSKVWLFQTGDEVDSSPVIAGDKVFFGSADGRLYGVRLKNGKQVWSYEIGAAIIGSPAVIQGSIIIGAEDGYIYAFGDKKS